MNDFLNRMWEINEWSEKICDKRDANISHSTTELTSRYYDKVHRELGSYVYADSCFSSFTLTILSISNFSFWTHILQLVIVKFTLTDDIVCRYSKSPYCIKVFIRLTPWNVKCTEYCKKINNKILNLRSQIFIHNKFKQIFKIL